MVWGGKLQVVGTVREKWWPKYCLVALLLLTAGGCQKQYQPPSEQALEQESKEAIEEFKTLKAKAEKEGGADLLSGRKRQVESDAKEIAAALLKYGTEHGTADAPVFPPKGAELAKVLAPHISAPEVFLPVGRPPKGGAVVVYTFSGGKLKDSGAGAAQVEIAHKKGPGGQAVIYADGHTEWKEATEASGK